VTVKIPKKFPVYVVNGSVSISIFRTKNGKYTNFRIRWKEGGQEKKENFADYGDAHKRAEFIAKNLAEGRIELTGMKVSDMEMLADLRKRIEPTKLTLSQVIDKFMSSWEPDVKDVTVQVAYDAYSKAKENKSKAYKHDIKVRIGGLAKKYGKRLVSSLTRDELIKFIEGKLKNGRSKNNRLQSVCSFLNWCKEEEQKFLPSLIPHVLENKKAFDEDKFTGYKDCLMPASDLLKVFVAASQRTELENRDGILAILALEAFAGVRVEESQRIKWDDVKWNKDGSLKSIWVRHEDAKTGNRRNVGMTDALKTVFSQIKRQESGKLSDYMDTQKVIRKLTKKAGVKWKYNMFRHTFITHQSEITGDIARVSKGAGNSPAMVTGVYMELSDIEEAKAWFNVATQYRLISRYEDLRGSPVPEPTPDQIKAEKGEKEDAPEQVDDYFDPEIADD
jgi:integrase